MSPLPWQDVYNAQAPQNKLLTLTDIKSVLSDALLSFSPLATLVGADSTRALAHRATNLKQSLLISLAPIGALGMMATACKGSNLSGLKEMLGVGEGDIHDAAREVGCGVAIGDALPRMDKYGGLICNVKGSKLEDAAHAVVRLNWKTSIDSSMDFNALRWIAENFFAVTISGRVSWKLSSEDAVKEAIPKVQAILLSSWGGMAFEAFAATHELPGGSGIIEISWPAPAMPLETHPFVVYLYVVAFFLGFLSIASFSASPHLFWQSPLASALLFGGQVVLALGHCTTHQLVRYQRKTLRVSIPKMDPNTGWAQWMLVDKPKFSSLLARRPLSPSRLSPNKITLSQHHIFKQLYVDSAQALFTLAALCCGFIAFYIGGKASNVKTVLIYIGLFVLANVTKGLVVSLANKPYYTRLNNFKISHMVEPDLGNKVKPRNLGDDPTNNLRPDSDRLGSSTVAWKKAFPDGFQIYSKFLVRSRKAVDLFYFSKSDEWSLAAHIISNTVKPYLSRQSGLRQPEDLLEMPLYSWRQDHSGGGQEYFHGLLLMAMNNTEPQDLFRSVGMEVVMILMDNYASPMLPSEGRMATDISFLAGLVYSCTRMLLSDRLCCGDVTLNMKVLGSRSLMYAIEETARISSNPQQEMPSLSSILHAAAKKAKMATSARSKVNTTTENEEFETLKAKWIDQNVKLKMKEFKELDERLDTLEKLDRIVMKEEGWKDADLFQPLWASDLKQVSDFVELSIAPLKIAMDEQERFERFVQLEGITHTSQVQQETRYEARRLREPERMKALEQVMILHKLLDQELICLQTYQRAGLKPHHEKTLASSQRLWLQQLKRFQQSTSTAPELQQSTSLPLSVASPTPEQSPQPKFRSWDEQQTRELQRLRNSPKLRQLQQFQMLHKFLQLLKSEGHHSPYQKQAEIAADCADKLNSHLAQEPVEKWLEFSLFRQEDVPGPVTLITIVIVIVLSVIRPRRWQAAFIIPATLLTVLIGKSRLSPNTLLTVSIVLTIAGILSVSNRGGSEPDLDYLLRLFSKTLREAGQEQKKLTQTKMHLQKMLGQELRVLRAEMWKRRAPLRALLDQQVEDWDKATLEADLGVPVLEQAENLEGTSGISVVSR